MASVYPLQAVVKRIVIDHITLAVEAETSEEAYEKAEQVLLSFPKAHTVPGVGYCFIEHRANGDIDILSLEEQEEHGEA